MTLLLMAKLAAGGELKFPGCIEFSMTKPDIAARWA
jgi:hypothetical protein